MKLINQTKNNIISEKLEKADSFLLRLKGLLGRTVLADNEALWIEHCSSIHTFFMNFSIDVIFVDRNLKVKKLYEDVRPGRLTWPAWGASSVFELPKGKIALKNINLGDQLNVGH